MRRDRSEKKLLDLARGSLQARATRLVGTIKASSPAASPSLLEALEEVASGAARQTAFDALAGRLKSENDEERIEAARWIGELTRDHSWTPDLPRLPLYTQETAVLLAASLSDNRPEVQRDLLKAFLVLKFGGAELLSRFVELLSSGQWEVRKAALEAIWCLGIDVASRAVDSMSVLLTDPITDVRLAACEALKSLEADATRAVPALAECVRSEKESSVRQSAARALTAIDPQGKALAKMKSLAMRDAIIAELAELGVVGRQLRRQLPSLWEVDDLKNPARWMSIPEIAKTTSHPQRTLRNWIRVKIILPHERMGAGKATRYLVTQEELVAWKALCSDQCDTE